MNFRLKTHRDGQISLPILWQAHVICSNVPKMIRDLFERPCYVKAMTAREALALVRRLPRPRKRLGYATPAETLAARSRKTR